MLLKVICKNYFIVKNYTLYSHKANKIDIIWSSICKQTLILNYFNKVILT